MIVTYDKERHSLERISPKGLHTGIVNGMMSTFKGSRKRFTRESHTDKAMNVE